MNKYIKSKINIHRIQYSKYVYYRFAEYSHDSDQINLAEQPF